ncbi:MAG: DUF305 domain-containing protein [Gemmatimonadota bacterium]|nr:DUF305 domain-containing protein [Gemmatimonadota bacterium]
MKNILSRIGAIVPLAAAVAVADVAAQSSAPLSPAAQAKADSGRMPYTAADVRFMQGMIGHHAQAVVMAGWAPTHGANQGVRILASRIDVAQRDEIAFMQRWLRERHETVPEAMTHDMSGHDMAGMAMPALMPGMLTAEQMAQLSKANGAEFDRLFLTFMIQHHQGALTMVDQLFGSPGAGQDLYVFRFASDVDADQTTEIDRMRLMLGQPTDGRRP